MPHLWAKVDVGFARNRKRLKAGLEGSALFVAGLGYSTEQVSEGIIPLDVLPTLDPLVTDVWTAVRKLQEVGMLHDAKAAKACRSEVCHRSPRPAGDEVLIHDWPEYSDDREQILERRDRARANDAERQRRRRERLKKGDAGRDDRRDSDGTTDVMGRDGLEASAQLGGDAGRSASVTPGVTKRDSRARAGSDQIRSDLDQEQDQDPRSMTQIGQVLAGGSNGAAAPRESMSHPDEIGEVTAGIVAKLVEVDPAWAGLRWGPLIRVQRTVAHGDRTLMLEAVQRLWESPPATVDNPAALLTRTIQMLEATRGSNAGSQAAE